MTKSPLESDLRPKVYILIFLLACLTLSSSYYRVYSANNEVAVDIGADGLATVSLNATLSKGINKIDLPISPIPETIVVEVDGQRITPIYYNYTLVIPAENEGTAYISYTANVSVVGGKMVLEIGSAEILLKAVNNIVLLSLPDNVEEAYTKDGTLILRFTGPAEISYTVATKEVKPTQNIPLPPSNIPWIYIISGIVALAVIVSIIIYMRQRTEGLDSTDREIIEYLKRRGGQALQSEIMNELKIPKTTLWRHVKRLEREGIVTVEQVGRVNIVKLRK
jgi:uncharacterized membrane protein